MRRCLLALTMVGLVVLVSGCASNAKATPTPLPALLMGMTTTPRAVEGRPPAIAFDKLQVDLGTVFQDQEGIQTFLVMSSGDKPLKVGQVSVLAEQGSASAVDVLEGEPELQPGEGLLLPIKLGRHEKLGLHRLLVSVPSNDPKNPVATLTVRFEVVDNPLTPGTGPHLRVDKDMIDIGRVPSDWPLYEQFTLRNDGDAPLIIEGTPVVRVEEGC